MRLLIITHALAAFASLTNALFWPYKFMALIMVGGSLFIYLRCYHYQCQPYQLKYNEDSAWSVAITNNDFQPMKILPSSVITSWLIVLHFRLENGKRHNILILNDALNEKDYRALVVTLKIAGLNQDENIST